LPHGNRRLNRLLGKKGLDELVLRNVPGPQDRTGSEGGFVLVIVGAGIGLGYGGY
jgi:hypothetical protein